MKYLITWIVSPVVALGFHMTLNCMPQLTNAALVGEWTFENDASATIVDTSGKTHNGTSYTDRWISGALVHSAGAVLTNAVNFDGMNDYIEIPSHSDFDLTTNATIEAWVKFTNIESGERIQTIVQRGSESANTLYWLYFNRDNETQAMSIAFKWGDGSSRTNVEWSLPAFGSYHAPMPTTNQWYHIALTFDSGVATLFVNGCSMGSRSSPTITSINTSGHPVYLGSYGNWGWHLNGMLDDVRIFNIVRNPTQIRQDADLYAWIWHINYGPLWPDQGPSLDIVPVGGVDTSQYSFDLFVGTNSVYHLDTLPSTNFTVTPVFPDGNCQIVLQIKMKNSPYAVVQSTADYLISCNQSTKHLLLYTFKTPRISALTTNHLDAIDKSPYNAVGTWPYPYNSTVNPLLTDLDSYTNLVLNYPRVEVWPLLFFNRFGGPTPTNSSPNPAIWRGWNLADENNSLTAFHNIVQTSARFAKSVKSPGLFVDPEPYSMNAGDLGSFYYLADVVSNLATYYNSSEEAIIATLREIGADIAHDVADSDKGDFANAVIWFYRIQLGVKYRPTEYIVEGILDEINNHPEWGMQVVSQIGEYRNRSLDACRDDILEDHRAATTFTQKYGASLKLGPTIQPYYDVGGARLATKTSFIDLNIDNPAFDIFNIDDYASRYRFLLSSHEFVWVYGASSGGSPYFDDSTGNDEYNMGASQAYDLTLYEGFLMGRWGFEEGGDSVAYDGSDYHNDAVLYNHSWNNFGRIGKAISLNGTSSYGICPDDSSFDITDELTIETWVKFSNTDLSGTHTVLNRGSAANNRYFSLKYDASGAYWYFSWGDGAQTVSISKSWSIPDTNWHHVAVSFQNTREAVPKGQATWYIDGAKTVGMPKDAYQIASSGELFLGSYGGTSQFFSGLLDEVRIYRRILPDYAILSHFNEPKLIGSWPLSAVSGVTARDISVWGNHGTLVNGPAWRWIDGDAPASWQSYAGGLIFDGSNDRVDCGVLPSLPTSGVTGLTMSAWIKLGDGLLANNNYVIMDRGVYDQDDQIRFCYRSSNPARLGFIGASGSNTTVISDALPELGTNWHHVAMTFNNGTVKFYCDGATNGTVTTARSSLAATGNFLIGAAFGGDTNNFKCTFKGVVHDVRLYNRALTDEEVSLLP